MSETLLELVHIMRFLCTHVDASFLKTSRNGHEIFYKSVSNIIQMDSYAMFGILS